MLAYDPMKLAQRVGAVLAVTCERPPTGAEALFVAQRMIRALASGAVVVSHSPSHTLVIADPRDNTTRYKLVQ